MKFVAVVVVFAWGGMFGLAVLGWHQKSAQQKELESAPPPCIIIQSHEEPVPPLQLYEQPTWIDI